METAQAAGGFTITAMHITKQQQQKSVIGHIVFKQVSLKKKEKKKKPHNNLQSFNVSGKLPFSG